MDVETLGVAMKKALPKASASDAGSVLVVSNEGTWTKGEPVTATISVSGTTLSITSEG